MKWMPRTVTSCWFGQERQNSRALPINSDPARGRELRLEPVSTFLGNAFGAMRFGAHRNSNLSSSPFSERFGRHPATYLLITFGTLGLSASDGNGKRMSVGQQRVAGDHLDPVRPLPALWSGPPTATASACDCSSPGLGAHAMSDSNDRRNDQKRELECLRLASDLRQLAKEPLDPELKAYCLRMAKQWSDQADESAGDDTGVDEGLD
jgi:hypothetical protein